MLCCIPVDRPWLKIIRAMYVVAVLVVLSLAMVLQNGQDLWGFGSHKQSGESEWIVKVRAGSPGEAHCRAAGKFEGLLLVCNFSQRILGSFPEQETERKTNTLGRKSITQHDHQIFHFFVCFETRPHGVQAGHHTTSLNF